MTTNLTPELQAQIDREAEISASYHFNPKYSYDQNTACRINYRTGAKKYALKWQEAEQRVKELEQWKKEATLLLNPLLDWGQAQKDIPLGKSITIELLRRAKLFTEDEKSKERYEKALKEIAIQKTCEETEADEDIPIGTDGKRMGDIEMGYDGCIETARKALIPKQTTDGE